MNADFSLDGTVPLPHWGVIRARGAEAAKFLQGQLTNDVASIGPSQVRLAGFCSAKGRLQASFLVWQSGPDELLMACSASVLPATLKRLSMFVLRAQCKLSDATGEIPLFGSVGPAAAACVSDLAAWHQRQAGSATLLRLPDVDGVPRAIVAGALPDGTAQATALTLAAWQRLEVRSGIPVIETATVDQFVPQMLNFEIVGGVDFHKGCYPGQEIVARSQYRGTIKRRMFLFTTSGMARPGTEVFHSADDAQPAGMVVNAAPSAEGNGSVALVEVKLAALEQGSLHLASVDGPVLVREEMPYAIPSDAALPA